MNENVDIYCGWTDKFSGKIVGCADGALTIETKKGVFTHISVHKIVAIWRTKQP